MRGGNQTIYYSHWRANRIAADLYLGEKRFLEFVRNCRVNDVLLNEVWIEGCVVIDFLKKGLYFWSCEFAQPSIEGLYLKELRKKWRGWNVNLLYNRIYDVEKILNIDYISKQERRNFTLPSIPEILDDNIEDDWWTATVIIKTTAKTFIIQTTSFGVDGILNFGEPIVEFLVAKPQIELPNELDGGFLESIVIDTVNKLIIIDKSEYDLWEQACEKMG